MPSSPASICRDCSNRAVNGTKYCADHQTKNSASERDALYEQNRSDDSIRQLYRTRRWIKGTRVKVLNRDILCVACGHRRATEADHILSARLVVDNFGVDEFYNPDRCQGLCHSCHSSKTATEYGWTGRKGTRLEQLTDRSNTTVVCGSAGSGKSTYVQQHKQPNDPVFDYDVVMSEITGLPMHQSLPGAIGSVLAKRDQFIESTAYCPHRVWIIVSNPNAVIVRMLRDAGATVVLMNTPDEVCTQRLLERFNDAVDPPPAMVAPPQ
jgi:5-methylcytosine-specific restriction endonuclease McrA